MYFCVLLCVLWTIKDFDLWRRNYENILPQSFAEFSAESSRVKTGNDLTLRRRGAKGRQIQSHHEVHEVNEENTGSQ